MLFPDTIDLKYLAKSKKHIIYNKLKIESMHEILFFLV